MFQLICDPSGVVVETTLKELLPAVIKWGNKLDHVLRVLISHILSSAQVFVSVCAFCYPLWLITSSLTLFEWISIFQFAALSLSFCSWWMCRIASTWIGGKRALEYRCSIENAGGIAFFGAPESNWNMSIVHFRNYTVCVRYHIAWIVCKVSWAKNVQFEIIPLGSVKELA